jgi:hypothetical protein
MDWNHVAEEFVKALVTALFVTVGALLTALFWSLWQKRRELQLTAANDFNKLYGEFFSIWKLWNEFHRNYEADLPNIKGEGQQSTSNGFEENREFVRSTYFEILRRAATAEGQVEALLVRLATESHLRKQDAEILGRFRQGCQRLRKHIEDGKQLDWSSHVDIRYRTFKFLACYLSHLLAPRITVRLPTPYGAGESLAIITSNEWEEHRRGWLIEKTQLPSLWPDPNEIPH